MEQSNTGNQDRIDGSHNSETANEIEKIQAMISHLSELANFYDQTLSEKESEALKEFSWKLAHGLLGRAKFKQSLDVDTVEEILAMVMAAIGLAHYAGTNAFVERGNL